MLKLLGSKEFESEMVLEGSWGHRDLGPAKNEMRFYVDNGRTFIEWEVNFPDGDQDVEHIGLWFDNEGYLIDYDGIMGYLPTQAADLIEGIKTTETMYKFYVNRKEYCQ